MQKLMQEKQLTPLASLSKQSFKKVAERVIKEHKKIYKQSPCEQYSSKQTASFDRKMKMFQSLSSFITVNDYFEKVNVLNNPSLMRGYERINDRLIHDSNTKSKQINNYNYKESDHRRVLSEAEEPRKRLQRMLYEKQLQERLKEQEERQLQGYQNEQKPKTMNNNINVTNSTTLLSGNESNEHRHSLCVDQLDPQATLYTEQSYAQSQDDKNRTSVNKQQIMKKLIRHIDQQMQPRQLQKQYIDLVRVKNGEYTDSEETPFHEVRFEKRLFDLYRKDSEMTDAENILLEHLIAKQQRLKLKLKKRQKKDGGNEQYQASQGAKMEDPFARNLRNFEKMLQNQTNEASKVFKSSKFSIQKDIMSGQYESDFRRHAQLVQKLLNKHQIFLYNKNVNRIVQQPGAPAFKKTQSSQLQGKLKQIVQAKLHHQNQDKADSTSIQQQQQVMFQSEQENSNLRDIKDDQQQPNQFISNEDAQSQIQDVSNKMRLHRPPQIQIVQEKEQQQQQIKSKLLQDKMLKKVEQQELMDAASACKVHLNLGGNKMRIQKQQQFVHTKEKDLMQQKQKMNTITAQNLAHIAYQKWTSKFSLTNQTMTQKEALSATGVASSAMIQNRASLFNLVNPQAYKLMRAADLNFNRDQIKNKKQPSQLNKSSFAKTHMKQQFKAELQAQNAKIHQRSVNDDNDNAIASTKITTFTTQMSTTHQSFAQPQPQHHKLQQQKQQNSTNQGNSFRNTQLQQTQAQTSNTSNNKFYFSSKRSPLLLGRHSQILQQESILEQAQQAAKMAAINVKNNLRRNQRSLHALSEILDDLDDVQHQHEEVKHAAQEEMREIRRVAELEFNHIEDKVQGNFAYLQKTWQPRA